jgi:hypothetical protein
MTRATEAEGGNIDGDESKNHSTRGIKIRKARKVDGFERLGMLKHLDLGTSQS